MQLILKKSPGPGIYFILKQFNAPLNMLTNSLAEYSYSTLRQYQQKQAIGTCQKPNLKYGSEESSIIFYK